MDVTLSEINNKSKKETVWPRLGDEFPFWRRLFALAIDIFILSLLGKVLGTIFYDVFVKIGFWGRMIGVIISLFYFGLLNSSLNNGQTVGKRILDLKVINKSGDCISWQKSCFRFLILVFPFWLNGISTSELNLWLVLPLLIIFCYGIGIVYFYMFNFETRQGLHDIICQTYVVKQESKKRLGIRSISKRHFVIYTLICILMISSGMFVNFKFSNDKALKKNGSNL
ncbi:MAG: RDD family protein [Bacillota bacterium]